MVDTVPGSVIPTTPARVDPNVTPMSVQNPQGAGGSPLQYWLANGGNPAMAQQFLNYLSSLPGNIAQQYTANPAMGMSAFVQGVRGDPASMGLSYQNGNFVNSAGTAYDSSQDAAYQAQLANQSQGWNNMFQNSNLWNAGGQFNVDGPNPYLNTPTSGNIGPMMSGPRTNNAAGYNPNGPTPGVTTKPLQLNGPTTTPPPAGGGRLVQPTPTTPAPTNYQPQGNTSTPAVVAKTTPDTTTTPATTPTTPAAPVTAVTGGAQYNQQPVNQQLQPNAAQNPGVTNSGAGSVNPYAPTKNPYGLNNTKGWNI